MSRKPLNADEIASLFWQGAKDRANLAWHEFPTERMAGFFLSAKQGAWLFDVLCRDRGIWSDRGHGSLYEDGQNIGRWEAKLTPNGSAGFKVFFAK